MEKKITGRALLAGMSMAAIIGTGAAYENLMISGSPLAFDYSTGAAIFLFSLFVLVANSLLRLIRPGCSLNRVELATVYIMGTIACSLPTNGLVGKLIAGISGGIYYATVENDWANLVTPFVRPGVILSDPQAVKGFYEGLARGESIPWMAWVRSLLHWTPLLLGFFGSVIALAILLRKQWIVNERLLFPLVQVPIAMIGEKGVQEENGIAPFFKNGAVWLGVLIPLVLNTQRALSHYYPTIPEGIPMWYYLTFFNRAVVIPWTWNYACLGYSYLLATKLSFSLWLLGLLTIVEDVVFVRLGLVSSQWIYPNTSASVYPAYQGFGALLMFSLLVLWTARHHFREVWHCAWGSTPDGADRQEILSYRQVCLLLLGSLILLGVGLWRFGSSWWLILPLLAVSFLAMIGITRIVAEGGLAVSLLPMMPSEAIISAAGGTALGMGNLTALGFSNIWIGELRTSVMSAFIHGLKLAEVHVIGQRRRLMAAVVISIATSMACAIITTLFLGYRFGGINLSGWFFGDGSGGWVYKFITYHSNSGPLWGSMGFVGAGAAVQLVLTLAYQRFQWWPIHPLGFPIGAIWCTHQMMPSLFVAWLTKVGVLHYGGVRLYHRTKPFFLGLILGQYLSGGLWVVIDGFTGMQSNYLFFW